MRSRWAATAAAADAGDGAAARTEPPRPQRPSSWTSPSRDGRLGRRGHGARVARGRWATRWPWTTRSSRSPPTRSTPSCPRPWPAPSPRSWPSPTRPSPSGTVLCRIAAGAGAPAAAAPVPPEPAETHRGPAPGGQRRGQRHPRGRPDRQRPRHRPRARSRAAARAGGSPRRTCWPRSRATAQPRRPRRAEVKPIRGPAATLARFMDESRSIPTATSFRTLPVDVLDARRTRAQGGRPEALLHPPDRLGDRAGRARHAGDGQLLRRGGRQAAARRAGGDQPRPGRRRGAQGRHALAGRAGDQATPSELDFADFVAALRRAGRGRARQHAAPGRLRGRQHHAHQPGRHRHRRLACRA